jgi:protein TonB
LKKVLLILLVTLCALKTKAQTVSDQNSPILEHVDTMPEYIGGMDKFYQRLSRINYTFLDRMSECQGRVTVLMVVEKDGSLTNLKILNGFSAAQDQEILRVFKRLNKWRPGMQNGKPIRVLCSVPINFKIKESS